MTELRIQTGITGSPQDGWRVYLDVTDPETGDVQRMTGERVHRSEQSANDAVAIFQLEARAYLESAGHTITEHPIT